MERKYECVAYSFLKKYVIAPKSIAAGAFVLLFMEIIAHLAPYRTCENTLGNWTKSGGFLNKKFMYMSSKLRNALLSGRKCCAFLIL